MLNDRQLFRDLARKLPFRFRANSGHPPSAAVVRPARLSESDDFKKCGLRQVGPDLLSP